VEFLVEFEINIPDGTPASEVRDRDNAEAAAAAKLVDEGHLVRLWKPPVAPGETKVLGLYRASARRPPALRMDAGHHHAARPASQRPGASPDDRLTGQLPGRASPSRPRRRIRQPTGANP